MTITYNRTTPHPLYRREQLLTVTSPGELRQVVLDARHDPRVADYRYRRMRRLIGAPQQSCPAGHPWQQSPPGTPVYWHQCGCGGHQALRCAGLRPVAARPAPRRRLRRVHAVRVPALGVDLTA